MCMFCLLAKNPTLCRAATAGVRGALAAPIRNAARRIPASGTALQVRAAGAAPEVSMPDGKPIHPAFGAPGRFAKRMEAGPVICAEGYLFELERRGYIQIGPFVPEVVLSDPEAVKQLHREFLRAGSDIIEAFTYYGHRSKMRLVGKEHLLEPLNRHALRIAQEVAMEAMTHYGASEPALVAGNVCNTTVWDGEKEAESRAEVRPMFDEQIGWAVEHGVDLVIGETFDFLSEAMEALEAIKAAGDNVPSVITMAVHTKQQTRDGYSTIDCLNELKSAGATVVGLNCARGPKTMMDMLPGICEAVPGPIAALPVAYKTDDDHPTFQSMSTIDMKYTDLDPWTCTRYDFEEFTKQAVDAGATYLGVCCGGAPHHVRAIAAALGREPPSAANNPDLSKHFAFGTKEGLGDLAVENSLNYRDTM